MGAGSINTNTTNNTGSLDLRRQALDEWVAKQTGQVVKGACASSDASTRRYFRYTLSPAQSVIAMDAPTETQDCRPFIDIAARLASCGVSVPRIIARDVERGFLLLSDLGDQTYLDVLSSDNADNLVKAAINTLICFQRFASTESLPVYNAAFLQRELELFPEWYLQAHLGMTVDQSLRSLLDQLFNTLIERALSQATVFVHRDYMPRNLMPGMPGPGVLDFQDAVLGPVAYDPVSLVKDAFISWPETDVQRWLRHYWQQARVVGLPVPEDFAHFQMDCDFIGAQRHLKIIGIFARIFYRDGKSGYLDDVPRFFTYLTAVAQRYPELSTLKQLLERLTQHGKP